MFLINCVCHRLWIGDEVLLDGFEGAGEGMFGQVKLVVLRHNSQKLACPVHLHDIAAVGRWPSAQSFLTNRQLVADFKLEKLVGFTRFITIPRHKAKPSK
jgi:hypothetical protein